MKMLDRFAADKKTWAGLSRQERIAFVWDYYKLPVLGAGILVLLLALTLLFAGERRDVALYAVFVNTGYSDTAPDSAALDELLARAGVDMTGRQVDVTANLSLGLAGEETYDGQTVQVLAALFGISGLDVFAADEAVFQRYAVQNAFVDLSLFLEPELLEAPYRYENPDGHTVTGGVRLTDSLLHELGYYQGEILVGIAANAQNLDNAIAFLRQLLEG